MEITGGTIARTVILALALINQILSSTGHPVIPIPNEDIETLSIKSTIHQFNMSWNIAILVFGILDTAAIQVS